MIGCRVTHHRAGGIVLSKTITTPAHQHMATFSRYATGELRNGPVTFQLAKRAEKVSETAAASSGAPYTRHSTHADHHLRGTKRSIQTERAQQKACALTRSRVVTRASQGIKERGTRQTTRTFGMRTTCRRRLRIEVVDIHFCCAYSLGSRANA